MRQRWPGYQRNYRAPKRCRKRIGKRPLCLPKKIMGLLLFFGVTAGILLLDLKMQPLVAIAAKQQAGELSVQTITQTIEQILKEQKMESNYLKAVEEESGKILSITTDSDAINQIKSQLQGNIQQELKKIENCTVNLPIGTLMGGNLFRGLGPSVPLRIPVKANAHCNMKSSFDSAGINQTRYRLFLSVCIEVFVLIPEYNTPQTVQTEFLISETILVGTVPNLLWNGKNTVAQEN